ncbi:MAG: DUF362 domain-containing protein [Syntrophales bacterium]
MGKVSIVRTAGEVGEALIRALDLIGGPEQFMDHNDVIMLKPNLNGTEGFTDIRLAESMIRLILDFRVKRLLIAESCFGNPGMTDMFFNKTGYSGLAKRYGIDLINLNKSEAVETRVKKPLILDRLKIAREVFEVDRIINMPVMKVHYATGVTLSLKNLKGLLVGDEKRRFHEVGLDRAIVDLNNTIKPDLNIIDCISCMERMGPRGGDVVNLNLLIAGRDCAEVDYVGMEIMGYRPDEVRHFLYYINENNVDVNGIEVAGEKISDVKYKFKKAKLENILPGSFRIRNRNACSSCMNALLLSCQILEKPASRDVLFYLGSDLDEEKADAITIAFGNCCTTRADRRIRGCPPYPFELKRILEGS